MIGAIGVAREATIELHGMRVPARIGVSDAELEVERPLLIDVTLRTAANAATASDAIADTVDYAAVAGLVAGLVRERPHRTLEHLAARLADAVAAAFGPASVAVVVSKPDPPMQESVERVSVRVEADG